MKGLLRGAATQAILAWLLALYLRPVLATVRWRHLNHEIAEAAWAKGGGVVLCFWHSRIALSPAGWPMDRVRAETVQTPRALISLSPDGAFIAAAMERLGFAAIRGSSTKASDKAKPKGGAAAFREAVAWLAGGGALAITPDGPRGPAETLAEGAVRLAQRTGAPVLLVGLACRPALRLNSWDRAMLPLPFGKGMMVWTGPFTAAPGDNVETLRRDWEARLARATREAEAALT